MTQVAEVDSLATQKLIWCFFIPVVCLRSRWCQAMVAGRGSAAATAAEGPMDG